MTRIVWDLERNYSAGVDHCVLYLPAGAVAWNGVSSVVENPDDLVGAVTYLDGVVRLRPVLSGDFSLQVEAITYPDEFDDFLGSFGFSYRTKDEHGYKIHLVYNAKATPSEVLYKTISDRPDPSGFVWTFVTVPVQYPGIRPTAHFIIDVSKLDPDALSVIEDDLYGTDTTDPNLLSFAEIVESYLTATMLRIFDNADGTWTAVGPESAITMLDPDTFQISWPTAVFIDANSYTLTDG